MKIIDSKSLGNVIRARRKELHYTQQDISDNTGYSISFLSDLENGKPTAEIGRAIDVVNLLGLDIMIKERKS
ncbi:MAG: helix-turn-helix transcriptional regulator [Spirochaetia bacterium]|nr:helix-turn-helix transcriptional regulator [Spirochaetia bacterium]MBR0319071.1 helix-turn-helix transcriptional regulator [Spirochaetia bacterium]